MFTLPDPSAEARPLFTSRPSLGVGRGVRRARVERALRRRGTALFIVMLTISASLILSMSLLRSQSTALQIVRNVGRGDLALQAAETGIALGLEGMPTSTWSGVETTISRTVISNDEGTAACLVTYLPCPVGAGGMPNASEAGLCVRIRSVGRWQSRQVSTDAVERKVECLVRLEPRVVGRPIGAGDSAFVNDVVVNPTDYGTIQNYSLFAKGTAPALVLDPCSRIEGNAWLQSSLQLFDNPRWSAAIRNETLTSIGDVYGTGGVQFPHPIGNSITFRTNPTSAVQTDLARLKAAWTTTNSTPSWPAVTFSDWATYKLFHKGFTFNAAVLPSSLSNTTLRPTADNPLGIYYRNGSVTLGNDVTIHGTIVCSGTLTISGKRVRIAAFDWRGDDGSALVANRHLWPRQPAIVAASVAFARNTKATVDGAIFATGDVTSAGCDYSLATATNVDTTLTVTAKPLQSPHSLLQSWGAESLYSLSSGEKYAVWIESGTSGRWHDVVSVNPAARQLTVVGELSWDAPVPLRITRARESYVDIRGPISANKVSFQRPDDWYNLTSSRWSSLNSTFDWHNFLLGLVDAPPIPWILWLTVPSNFNSIGSPYSTYGLNLEPTLHLRNSTGTSHLLSPKLFTPYSGTGSYAAHSGYRWRILSWSRP